MSYDMEYIYSSYGRGTPNHLFCRKYYPDKPPAYYITELSPCDSVNIISKLIPENSVISHEITEEKHKMEKEYDRKVI
mgnify:CR=1 FL=1